MKLALLEQLTQALRRRDTVVLVTDLQSGAQRLIGARHSAGDLDLRDLEIEQVQALRQRGRSQLLQQQDRELFVEICSPPVRLVIIGAVHIAQALVPAARLAGLEPFVVDPRAAFASASRFPDTPLVVEWPEQALAGLRLDHRTALVTMTHNPRIDDPALLAALASDACYVGALGSRRTHDQRKKRLAELGVDAAGLGRIRAPVGLAIGAVTPGEIALSIVAEIVATLRMQSPEAVR